ncbi:hypothetical protein ACOMHN_010680 [Nucella lapillus]
MITVYISSVTLKKELHAQQSHIETVLRAKHLPFELIDIATQTDQKDIMREKIGNPTALAPQIFSDGVYCGDYQSFSQAVEEEDVLTYLKVVW